MMPSTTALHPPHPVTTPRRSTRRPPVSRRALSAAVPAPLLVALLASGCATTGGPAPAAMAAETFETTSSLDAAATDAPSITSRPALNRASDRSAAARVAEPLTAPALEDLDLQPRTEVRAGQELALVESSAARATRESARDDEARTNAVRYSLVDCALAPGEAERLEERTEVLYYRPTETCYGPCRLFAVESANPDVDVPSALVLRDRDGDWTTDLKACPPPRR